MTPSPTHPDRIDSMLTIAAALFGAAAIVAAVLALSMMLWTLVWLWMSGLAWLRGRRPEPPRDMPTLPHGIRIPGRQAAAVMSAPTQAPARPPATQP
jgi:hypothetical protein